MDKNFIEYSNKYCDLDGYDKALICNHKDINDIPTLEINGNICTCKRCGYTVLATDMTYDNVSNEFKDAKIAMYKLVQKYKFLQMMSTKDMSIMDKCISNSCLISNVMSDFEYLSDGINSLYSSQDFGQTGYKPFIDFYNENNKGGDNN